MREMKETNIKWFPKLPSSWKTGRMKNVINILTDYTSNGSFADLAKNVQYLDYEAAAARAVNNLQLTTDADGKISGSIVTVDTRYYENSARAIAANLAAKARNGNLFDTGGNFNPGALTIAVDITNGRTYLGLSGLNDKNPTLLSTEAPLLTNRIEYVCQTYNCTLDKGLTSKPRNLRNCGEYNAINNALNDGANSQNLYVYTVYIGNGDYLRACENCRALFRGIVHFIGDDSEYESIPTAA